MARCGWCENLIVFGGVRDGRVAYCNMACKQNRIHDDSLGAGHFDEIERETRSVHSGPCPACGGVGPNDVYRSREIATFLIVSKSTTKQHICCRSCGRRKQWGAICKCLFAGWWGPTGLIATPLVIISNLIALTQTPSPDNPSVGLRRLVKAMYIGQVPNSLQGEPSDSGRNAFEVVCSRTNETNPPLENLGDVRPTIPRSNANTATRSESESGSA